MPKVTNVEKLSKPQLQAYLDRVGLSNLELDALQPTVEMLNKLHQSHTLQIPFENLALHLDPLHNKAQPLDISLPTVFKKIVTDHRGGYCYEMNQLFAAVLVSIGFTVYSHKAGVLLGYTKKREPAHRMLTVDIEGERYLADVGFGGPGQIAPLKCCLDLIQIQGLHRYQLVLDAEGDYELQKIRKDSKGTMIAERLYAVNVKQTYDEHEYHDNNHFTSMDPTSTFVKTLICTKPLLDGRKTLVGSIFKHVTINDQYEEIIENHQQLDDIQRTVILEKHFGIHRVFEPVAMFTPLYQQSRLQHAVSSDKSQELKRRCTL